MKYNYIELTADENRLLGCNNEYKCKCQKCREKKDYRNLVINQNNSDYKYNENTININPETELNNLPILNKPGVTVPKTQQAENTSEGWLTPEQVETDYKADKEKESREEPYNMTSTIQNYTFLTQQQRDILLMYVNEGMTKSMIAKQLGITKQAVGDRFKVIQSKVKRMGLSKLSVTGNESE